MSSPAVEFAERVLGEVEVLDRPPSRGGVVLHVRDLAGRRWFVKRTPGVPRFRREARAYRRWAPVLGESAPSLRAADQAARCLVLSAVPGRPARGDDPRAQRAAGALLRRLHAAIPARTPQPDVWGTLAHLWEGELDQCRRHGIDLDEGFVRSRLEALPELGLPWVPSHGDYQPRNWIVDEVGALSVVDFGEARWHARPWDLTRLAHGSWWRRPDLAGAFLEGYGRPLTAAEETFLEMHLVVNAVIAQGWGARHDVPGVRRRGEEVYAALRAGVHPLRPASRVRRTLASMASMASTARMATMPGARRPARRGG